VKFTIVVIGRPCHTADFALISKLFTSLSCTLRSTDSKASLSKGKPDQKASISVNVLDGQVTLADTVIALLMPCFGWYSEVFVVLDVPGSNPDFSLSKDQRP
jgi:hypothetical protein